MEGRNRKAWLAVMGCCLGTFWSGSMAFGYPGVVGTYWQQKFHVGAGATGTVVTFMLLALAASMFFSGKIHMKIGMRKCLLISTVFTVIAMFILINAKNIYMVYVWAFVVNIGCSFIYGPGLATVQQWFPHRRGLVSGLLNLIFGISAAIMSPIWNHMLDTIGYEQLNYILIICLIVTNLVAMIFAEVPDRTKLTEEERTAHDQLLAELAEKAKSTKSGAVSADLSLKEALQTKAFWLIWFIWVFMGAAGISMVSLSKSYAIFLGLSGVIILTTFNITNGIGRIIAGALTDVIGGPTTGFIAFIITAVGYFMLPHVNGLVAVSVFAAFVGFGLGTLFTITPPMASGIFGLKYFGVIFGVIFTAYGFIAGILGPAISGYVLDYTHGNYTFVFNYLAVFALIGAALIMTLKKVISK